MLIRLWQVDLKADTMGIPLVIWIVNLVVDSMIEDFKLKGKILALLIKILRNL